MNTLRRRPLFASTSLALAVALCACAPTPQTRGASAPHGAPAASAAQAGAAAASHDPPLAPSPALDALLARYVTARGGEQNLRALTSVRLTGTARFGGGASTIDVSYGVARKRPGSVRTEVSFQGLTSVDAFDGKDAWSTASFGGRKLPFRGSADAAKELSHEADLEGPLVDWRAKGHRVEYLGTEEIDGTLAHKLRVVRKDGDIEYRYLDPDAFLEIRVVTESRERGVEHISETDLGDYEEVGGVYFPFSIESGQRGAPRSARITIERGEANVALDDASFRFPEAGAVVGRVVVAGPADVKRAGKPGVGPRPADAPSSVHEVLSGLGARNIGSAAMSGRVSAVAAHNDGGKTTVYVGAASGGVWKSLDGGTTFKPVFDKQPVQSIGAITVDPSNPRTIWVGTGESWTRNSVSIGDGVYKSTDAGETWTNVGLKDSERISRILVHPKNGDIAYACVPGKLWSDSADRGLYRTADGGKTWSLILKGSNLSTGCSGVSMDPRDPDVLFTGMWDFRRKGWTSRSGGAGPGVPSGSGLFRSADGGKTWAALTSESSKGLPPGPWGRIEVVVAPSDSKRVYALIEAKDSALYASSDGGATWEARDKSQNMVWRPFYFARLVVDPKVADRLWKPDLSLIVSDDGGKSFSSAQGGAHGDWHDLWVDPMNTSHVIGGDDGGLWTSWDGGSRWWKSNNLPISQFYHVSVDAKDPYQVYGGLQDNSSWVGDSAYPGGITNSRWENLFGGDGFWVFVDPTDPDAVYAESQGGFVGRVDRRTLATRDIQPKAQYKEKLRFNWNTPLHASPTQKGTIYIGAQFLFRSRDRGDSWERISPDLTTNDPEKQKQEESGGITVDNSSAEMHTTIYSISESPRDARVVWAGTDDGNLQLTRDGGKTWTNTVGNVPALPKSSWVSWVEASRFDASTAYVAFDRHTFGDMTPWVYKTTDFGKSWTRIAGASPGVRGYAHVIKEDTVSKKLLFLGTELGLWISNDSGATWTEFHGGNFPSVAVRHVEVHPRDGDLVIATHGRGLFIVDDLTPLRALTPETLEKPVAFLPTRPAQQRLQAHGGWADGDATFEGRNPAEGASITYYQRARHLFGHLKLEVLDAKGAVVDTLTATKRPGINRVFWSMRVKPPRVPRAAQIAYGATQGPRVLPGTYTVRLTKGDEKVETTLVVGLDRRASFSTADRKVQFEAAMRAHSLFADMSALTERIDRAHSAAEERATSKGVAEPLVKKLRALASKLEDTKKQIVATKEGGAITGEERIREHLDTIYSAILRWEGKPARYQIDRIEALRRELADVTVEMDAIDKRDIAPIDAELRASKLPPLSADVDTDAARASGFSPAAIRCAVSRGVSCEETERAAAQTREERD